MNNTQLSTPYYLIDEARLRKNLDLISYVKKEANVEIILAFKAFATWKAFPIIREYIPYSTASSIYEAQLAFEEMGSLAHTYSPAYTDKEFDTIMKYSSHITFNSLAQFNTLIDRVESYKRKISCGLRINPEYSEVETNLYNPCAPGSRLGVTEDQLPDELPSSIEGLHFHTLCESTSFDLEKTLIHVEKHFSKWLPKIKWLNMGGGHLMTRKGYNIDHLIMLLKSFKARHPHLQLILEPGSAFTWQTGELFSTVVDVVENNGIKTAILDCSFACHMPDCLEMPYKPKVTDAVEEGGKYTYRLGGNSCLSGDFIGEWSFNKPLHKGDSVIFEDMIHYTIVKTNMFNGIPHPAIGIRHTDGNIEIYRSFGYTDFKNRVS